MVRYRLEIYFLSLKLHPNSEMPCPILPCSFYYFRFLSLSLSLFDLSIASISVYPLKALARTNY